MECFPLVDIIKYPLDSITEDQLVIRIFYPFVLLSYCYGTSHFILILFFFFLEETSEGLGKGKASTMFLVHCFS